MQQQADDRKKKKRRILLYAAFILLNIIIIGYIALVEFSDKPEEKLSIKIGWTTVLCFVMAAACVAAVLLAEACKYFLMMKSLKLKPSFKAGLKTAIYGKYYDYITPSGAGGQPFQIYKLHQMGYSTHDSSAMVLSSFIFMQAAFVLLAVIFLCIKSHLITSAFMMTMTIIGIILYALVPGFLVLFIFAPKPAVAILNFFIKIGAKLHLIKDQEKTKASVLETFEQYRDSVKTIGRNKLLLLKLLGFSVVFQVALCSLPFFMITAFGGNVQYIDILAMTFFIYASITIIPTPGNSGAAEGSFYILFSTLGTVGIFWSMLWWRVFCYYSFLLLGIALYAYEAVKNRWLVHKGKKQAMLLKEQAQQKENGGGA